MAGCPYKNFEECPQHNKRGGCEFWLSYSSNSESSVISAIMKMFFMVRNIEKFPLQTRIGKLA